MVYYKMGPTPSSSMIVVQGKNRKMDWREHSSLTRSSIQKDVWMTSIHSEHVFLYMSWTTYTFLSWNTSKNRGSLLRTTSNDCNRK